MSLWTLLEQIPEDAKLIVWASPPFPCRFTYVHERARGRLEAADTDRRETRVQNEGWAMAWTQTEVLVFWMIRGMARPLTAWLPIEQVKRR